MKASAKSAASMPSQSIQCWCKHQAEELFAGTESTGTLDKEVDAIRVNLKGFPDTEFFRVEVSYLTQSRNLDIALLGCAATEHAG